ncbi:discoidin domain-containing protein [Sphingobacterium sp. N143]|mgnify:CR=1 FL=1|uniref:PKD domain-containing protein n=1 Tax=Sphingobacterium sp. N143 TaxID=2746727 RepID=UPI0025771BF7|nr:PKD domain-containing protein [Sphingobacterium sp. N143]MDM1295409.1 discoidin domain-containing protein [Sphingobacterium sp. N143]
MMKIEKCIYSFFVLIFVLSCHKEKEVIVEKPQLPNPKSAFSVKQVAKNDPFTFAFTNQSKDYKEARWSFGDDSTSTVVSPQHTFLNTGNFTVQLKVLNENGDWAQREEVIPIDAEKLLQFNATKNGTGKLILSYESDVAIQGAIWSVLKKDTYEQVSDQEKADISIGVGSFETYKLEVWTPKGSQITVTKLLTDLGIVKDWTNMDNTFRISQDNSSGPDAGEGSKKLVDNDLTTKLFIGGYQPGLSWQFAFYQPQVINAYTITTGNDAPERDPKEWEIQASDDGISWVTLNSVKDYSFGSAPEDRRKSITFRFSNSKPYGYYRYVVKSVASGSNFQMSEFRLLELPR